MAPETQRTGFKSQCTLPLPRTAAFGACVPRRQEEWLLECKSQGPLETCKEYRGSLDPLLTLLHRGGNRGFESMNDLPRGLEVHPLRGPSKNREGAAQTLPPPASLPPSSFLQESLPAPSFIPAVPLTSCP